MEIVLIRHGKPDAAFVGEQMSKISADKYTRWVRAYNHSSVDKRSRPASNINRFESYTSVASDLTRAVQSAMIFHGQAPKFCWSVLREMDIPRYKLPWQFKPYTWLWISRILWMLGLSYGISANVESFSSAKKRAQKAASLLATLAQDKKHLIVFGHGFSNLYIRKALMANGWQLLAKSNDYWGETRLVKC